MLPLSPAAHINMDKSLIIHAETFKAALLRNLSDYFFVPPLYPDIEGVTFKVAGSWSTADL
tara:strand:- start:8 stop:190 length:183 start_codon:yes stop_codon:yes gene_type:complete